MSQLSSLTIPTEIMQIGDDQLIVSGLQPSHLGWLYVANKETCDKLWNVYTELKDPSVLAASFAGDFIVHSPVLAAQIIALALGSLPNQPQWAEDVKVAMAIPFSYQIECLIKIGGLTFSKELPPKKLLAMFLQEAGKHRQPTA